MRQYRIIACDLDDTLADTKQPISKRMTGVLTQLLDTYQLCIISGGNYNQLQVNVIARLNLPLEKLVKIHLMSTSGARYDHFSADTRKWVVQYQKIIPQDQRELIAATIETIAKKHDLWEKSVTGKRIEDRVTQVTFSALGQNATPDAKRAWDPTNEKRRRLQTALAEALPAYEVVINGNTSIDVLQEGVDKAFGIQELMKATGTATKDILFFGDSLYENGNDYPVMRSGIATIAVTRWQDTACFIEDNLL